MKIKWPVILRGKTRYQTLYAQGELLRAQQVRTTMDTREWLGRELDTLRGSVDKISPVHVDMDEQLAHTILDRMRGPLTIPQEASDWLIKVANGQRFQWTSPLGFNNLSGVVRSTITPEGTLILELNNHIGERLWQGEFTPPGYRKGIS